MHTCSESDTFIDLLSVQIDLYNSVDLNCMLYHIYDTQFE